MACHFTYSKITDKEKGDLKQGDLLKKTDELTSLLEKTFTGPLESDFKYFLVLTQSCDLVRRNNRQCKAQYISLAIVKPFDFVLEQLASLHQKDKFQIDHGICMQKTRHLLYNEVEKILNNNHPELFYLHEDPTFGLSECYCALLRISIAVKSEIYYETCVNAKVLELNENFRAKLGWLVGNLYSRVGTEDWVPKYKDKNSFRTFINKLLDNKFIWMEKKIYDKLLERLEDFPKEEITTNLVLREIEKIPIPTRIDIKRKVIREIIQILDRSGILKPEHDVERLSRRIESNPVFSAHIKTK